MTAGGTALASSYHDNQVGRTPTECRLIGSLKYSLLALLNIYSRVTISFLFKIKIDEGRQDDVTRSSRIGPITQTAFHLKTMLLPSL